MIILYLIGKFSGRNGGGSEEPLYGLQAPRSGINVKNLPPTPIPILFILRPVKAMDRTPIVDFPSKPMTPRRPKIAQTQ